MVKSNLKWQEVVGEEFIEAINQLQKYALGEGPAVCQVCGCELWEGDGVTVYAFRAAGNPFFEIGYVMCGADEHEHPSVFTRGVWELVVTGRIGICADVSTQLSWLVLIDPSPVVVSVVSSSAARTVGDDATRDTDTRNSDDTNHREGPTPLLTAVCEHNLTDGGEW